MVDAVDAVGGKRKSVVDWMNMFNDKFKPKVDQNVNAAYMAMSIGQQLSGNGSHSEGGTLA